MNSLSLFFLALSVVFFLLAVWFCMIARRSSERDREQRLAFELSKYKCMVGPLDIALMDDDYDLRQSHAPSTVHSQWEVN